MCNDYAREIEAAKWIGYLREMKRVPPFDWDGGGTPNNIAPQPHIKITEPGLIVRLKADKLVASMTTWAWKDRGRPVFNYVSEGRASRRATAA